LAIFATPTLQHHFWKRQQKAALKLKAIEEVNALTAQFIRGWIDANGIKTAFRPTLERYEKFSATDAAVKVLFGPQTYDA
jgi:hypothetical protein